MEPVPVPWDCADGFFESYLRRPEAYSTERPTAASVIWTAVDGKPEHRRPEAQR